MTHKGLDFQLFIPPPIPPTDKSIRQKKKNFILAVSHLTFAEIEETRKSTSFPDSLINCCYFEALSRRAIRRAVKSHMLTFAATSQLFLNRQQ
jgi:hypothetical protein